MTVAAVMAVILRMVKTLSNLYGVPFERERTRSIIIGLMGGAVPTGLGLETATEKIGLVFVERFENRAMPPAAAKNAS